MEEKIFIALTKDELQTLIIDCVNACLKNYNQSKEAEKFFNIHEAAEFLRLSVPTIYSKVSMGELPVMKRGNRLYFSSRELEEYLKSGRD